jgi:uncharacterized RDD family membrane protein YckC
MVTPEVVTTEKVPIAYRVAGVGARFLAWLIDFAFMLLLFFVGGLVTWVLAVAAGGQLAVAATWMMVWVFALVWGYFLLFEWLWSGQTPGKRLFGLRVIHTSGSALTFGGSALRNLVRFIDMMPAFYGVGAAAALCDRKARRLGDLAADTLVVLVERGARPLQAATGGGDDRGRLALMRLRLMQLDREQKQCLLDLCLRREQLRLAERARLFRSASLYLQGHLGLSPEQFESDEKFVLQLAASLS